MADLLIEELRRGEEGRSVGKVQMTFCESSEGRPQTSDLSEENRAVVKMVWLMESGAARCSPAGAILEAPLAEEADRNPHVEAGRD